MNYFNKELFLTGAFMSLMIYILVVAMVIFVAKHTRRRMIDIEPGEFEFFRKLFAVKPF